MRYLGLSFRGRTGRVPYVAFFVGINLFGFAFERPMRIAMRSLDNTFPPGNLSPSSLSIIWPYDIALPVVVASCVAAFWVVVALFAFSVRRLHDMDLSGWFIVLWSLFFFVLPDKAVSEDVSLTIRDAVWFGITALVPGTRGPNRYGPDVSDPSPPATFPPTTDPSV